MTLDDIIAGALQRVNKDFNTWATLQNMLAIAESSGKRNGNGRSGIVEIG